MSKELASQAKVLMNVRVLVATKDESGQVHVVSEHKFKNTATRLMTESICYYLTGAENTYKRGKGRPNYMGIGTMGITKQPWGESQVAEVADNFSDRTYTEGETTRPWFESTSLGLTTICGAVNPDESGVSTHFWDPELGWGKDAFTDEPSDEPIFQGELCTSRLPDSGQGETWDTIERIPILRSDVLSDCPADWDYGTDGYCSQAIFYGYASMKWVHDLLHPANGPQLDRLAISEFGLYEKNNTDPHGLETMLAGFRVPTPDDIVYVTDGEVILIEWRVSVRALMPYEGVQVVSEPAPTGIRVQAEYLGELPSGDNQVEFLSHVRGELGVRQDVTWTLDNQSSSRTTLTPDGLLTVDKDEASDVLYVTAKSVVDPWILAKCAVLTGLIKNLVTGISITTQEVTALEIHFQATVLGKGTFSQNVTWSMTGNENLNTSIDPSTGVMTIDFEETADTFTVTATSVDNSEIQAASAVVRIDKVSGSYVISDFTILT